MIDHEKFFKHIQDEEWNECLAILYRGKEEIKDDPLLQHAALIFVSAFIKAVPNYDLNNRGVANQLTKLWQIHHGGFYSLTKEHNKFIVNELAKRLPPGQADDFIRLSKKEDLDSLSGPITSNLEVKAKNSQNLRPAKVQFDTEIRETFNKRYVKVFLKDSKRLAEIQIVLKELPSVKNVNITDNQEVDLTVYPKRLSTAEEVEMQIVDKLSIIMGSEEMQHFVVDEILSGVGDKDYQKY